MLGRARLGESGLGGELAWDAMQFTSLKVKKRREQVSDGPMIYLARG